MGLPVRAALSLALALGVSGAAAPLDVGEVVAPAAYAKAKIKRVKRLPLRSNYPGVVPVNPGLRFPDPNRPAYNSGTVAPLAVPRQDPVVPGGGYVPQVAPAVRGPETYQDRVTRCTHQSGLGGLSGGQSSTYIHNCSM